MNQYHFGAKSFAVHETLHPLQQELCSRVLRKRNITLLCGYRDEAGQTAAFSSGASSKRWPDSVHNTMPSMAVDVAPWPIPEEWGDLDGQTPKARDLDWKERVKFYEMLASFEDSWREMCHDSPGLDDEFYIRFGKDWDGDGDYRDQSFDDLPHIEIRRRK